MKLFATVLLFACMALMFLVRREYKIGILFMSTILMTMVSFPVGGISAETAISVAFLMSEVINIGEIWRKIKSSLMLPFCIIAVLSFAICVATSPNLQTVSGMAHFGLLEMFTKQFALLYAFICLRRKTSLKPLLTISFVSLVLMTVVAYANYASGVSFLVDELYDETLVDYDFITAERFRVQATFVNPFDYGFICVLLALLHLYAYIDHLESPAICAVSQLCCIFGVFTCNCRTIWFCYLVCLPIFVLALIRDKKLKASILLGALVLAVLAFMLIPQFRKMFVWIASIFDPTSVTKGSSLAMRLVQLATVFYYIQGAFLFGRGVYFFNIDMGWENGSLMAADSDLYGLEGIYLNLLLERGFVGLFIFIAMMTLLIVFIVKHRKLGRRVYALGLSVFILYLAFCFMTGELSSTMPSFLILGYVIAVLDKRRRIVERKSYAKLEEKPVL